MYFLVSYVQNYYDICIIGNLNSRAFGVYWELLAIPQIRVKCDLSTSQLGSENCPKHDTLHPVAPSQSVHWSFGYQIIIENSNPCGKIRQNMPIYAIWPVFLYIHIAAYNTTIHRQLLFSFFCPYHLWPFPFLQSVPLRYLLGISQTNTIELWPIEHISNVH